MVSQLQSLPLITTVPSGSEHSVLEVTLVIAGATLGSRLGTSTLLRQPLPAQTLQGYITATPGQQWRALSLPGYLTDIVSVAMVSSPTHTVL